MYRFKLGGFNQQNEEVYLGWCQLIGVPPARR